jgi:hypothetical protein
LVPLSKFSQRLGKATKFSENLVSRVFHRTRHLFSTVLFRFPA